LSYGKFFRIRVYAGAAGGYPPMKVDSTGKAYQLMLPFLFARSNQRKNPFEGMPQKPYHFLTVSRVRHIRELSGLPLPKNPLDLPPTCVLRRSKHHDDSRNH